jgi:2-methylisocitrate lyase-like PEP mutase family enzyme
VSADFENGYADDPDGVADAIRRCSEAGASGASIEDYAGTPAPGLYDPDLAVERVAAAVTAARGLDRPFTITARCEAYLIGMEAAASEARDRLTRYAEAGADCVYAPGVRDRAEIRRLVEETGAPVNVLVGIPDMQATIDEMRALGVRRLSVGGSLARIGWQAVFQAIDEMVGGTFGYAGRAAREVEIQRRFGNAD